MTRGGAAPSSRISLLVPLGLVVLAVVVVAAAATGYRGAAPPRVELPSARSSAGPPSPPAVTADASLRPSAAPSATSIADAVLVGAGDIASCGSNADEATARLLDAIEGTVFTAGDNAYPSGSSRQFARCYDPTWGRHRERTLPVPGNHEYLTAEASAYFDYFGSAAGEADRGYYAVDVGSWRVIGLNSNCGSVSCGAGSEQIAWLENELEANRPVCSVAIWHHARFSSGEHGPDRRSATFWDALYEAGVDLVVSGHDHDYERFAPQDPNGRPDDRRGIRQFVVGTGGASLRDFESIAPNSEVREAGSHGVLELTLRSGGYSWRFVPVAGASFSDAGSGRCH